MEHNGNRPDQNATHRNALKRIEGLMRAKRGTPEGDRLDVLVTRGNRRGPCQKGFA